MWNLPRPGIELVSPALTGVLLSTVPPGKSDTFFSGPVYIYIQCAQKMKMHFAVAWRAASAAAESLQSCPTLCDPIDGSPPGSAIPGILQARTLEWVAISLSNA